ncbi:elongator complex protein 6 isoform 2-T2 [Megaptera novaeangliae]
MFPELNNLLNTTPDQAEQGKLTLLCDAKTDGSFLVHHFLSFYLKANCKVCFVALIQSFSHYNIVGQKLGNVVALVHDSGDAEDEENDILLNGLGHQSQLILRAEGLATGFCKDVHGQVRRGWGSLGAARLPSLGCPWDSVRLWGGLVGACLQVEGKPWKLCECRSQSAPSGAWPHAPRQVFHGGPFAAKGELLKRRWLSTGEGSKQRNSSAGPQQALYIQANTVPFKIETWDFPGGAVVKNPPANAEDLGSSPGPGRSHMPRSN